MAFKKVDKLLGYLTLISALGVSGAIPSLAAPVSVNAEFRRFSFAHGVPPVVSPNGNWVAYQVHAPDSDKERLFVTNIQTHEKKEICHSEVSCSSPSWSPNGSQIGFYSDEGGALQFWIYDLEKGHSRK